MGRGGRWRVQRAVGREGGIEAMVVERGGGWIGVWQHEM